MRIQRVLATLGIFVVLCVTSALAQDAPLFRLSGLDGKEYALADFRGRPVVLTFFTTWCPYCAKELPVLDKLYREYQEKADLIVLGIDLQEPEGVVRKFTEAVGVSFPVLLDTKGETGYLYRILGLPTLFFIDPQGKIADMILGGTDEATLRRKLDRILWFRGLLLPEVANLLKVLQGVTIFDFRENASHPFPEVQEVRYVKVTAGDDLSSFDPQGTYVVFASETAQGKAIAASLARQGFQRVYYLIVDAPQK